MPHLMLEGEGISRNHSQKTSFEAELRLHQQIRLATVPEFWLTVGLFKKQAVLFQEAQTSKSNQDVPAA